MVLCIYGGQANQCHCMDSVSACVAEAVLLWCIARWVGYQPARQSLTVSKA